MNTTLLGERVILNKFSNLGRWSTGIGIHAAQSGVYGSQCYSLVTEKKSFFHFIAYVFNYIIQVIYGDYWRFSCYITIVCVRF